MKTARNLWPGLVSWPNMLLALQRCRRRKRYSAAAAEFDFDSMNNLLHLQRELVGDSWVPGPYHHFRITDPKPRKISAAPFRDRIVHHAIVNVLEPVFEPRFIFDSYACRRGKGTHKAIQRGFTCHALFAVTPLRGRHAAERLGGSPRLCSAPKVRTLAAAVGGRLQGRVPAGCRHAAEPRG